MGSERSGRRVSPIWWGLAISAFLSLPYLAALPGFFTSDDWVHLSHSSRIPAHQVWAYFSPHVVWFYRPLQALQFGWLYHTFDLEPLPYSLLQWLMHLGVCVLVLVLARRLAGPAMGLLASAVFAAQWVYVDVLIWRSNFNTLQWALTTLGLCILFLRYLDSRRRTDLFGFYGLLLLNFLTKESATSTPLILAALWWWHSGERGPALLTGRLKEGLRLLGPIIGLTGLYVAARQLLVQDVYQGYIGLYYRFVPPPQALRQTLCAVNHLLLSFSFDPLVLPHLPGLRGALRYVAEQWLLLPVILAGVAWRRRSRLLGLSLMWVVTTLVPVVWLTDFHSSRFYYLPAVGSSLILAIFIRSIWIRAAGNGQPAENGKRLTPVRALTVAIVGYGMLANVSTVTLFCLTDREETQLVGETFRLLQRRSSSIPRGSLIVVRHLPASCFANGLGLAEMVRMALQDPTAHGVIDGQRLPDDWARRLQRIPSRFEIDARQQPLALRPVPPAGDIVSPSVTMGRGDSPRIEPVSSGSGS